MSKTDIGTIASHRDDSEDWTDFEPCQICYSFPLTLRQRDKKATKRMECIESLANVSDNNDLVSLGHLIHRGNQTDVGHKRSRILLWALASYHKKGSLTRPKPDGTIPQEWGMRRDSARRTKELLEGNANKTRILVGFRGTAA